MPEATTTPIATTAISIKDGFIKDEWSQLVEPAYRAAEGRAFLWTGRRPAVGQRTETQVIVADDGWCRLSGVVTDVGDLPSLDAWRDGDSCRLPSDVRANALPLDRQLALRDDFVERLGTLHGQTVTSHALLNPDFYDRQDGLPFRRARVYRVTHAADENRSFLWCVTGIEDVTDLPRDELPEAFRKWQEGSRVGMSRVARVSF